MVNINTLSKEIKTRDLIVGPKVTLKNLQNIEKIYLSKDCSENTIKQLQKFNNIIHTDLSKKEFSELCKKDFNISVISILKQLKTKSKQK